MSPDIIWYEVTIEDPKVFTRRGGSPCRSIVAWNRTCSFFEFRCDEFVEEFMYGNLRKQQLVKHWEGDTVTIDITRKVPPGVTASINGMAGNMDGRRYPNSGCSAASEGAYLDSTRGREATMQMKLAIAVCITGLAMTGWSSSVSAHHAFAAEFDANKPVNFKGTITKMEWVNPHTWLHIDVKNPDGTAVNWAIEAGTPNVLFRRGFTRDSLTPGTEIVVDGYQSKDGSHRANGRDLTFPDGRKLFLGSSGTGAPYELTPGAPPKTQ